MGSVRQRHFVRSRGDRLRVRARRVPIFFFFIRPKKNSPGRGERRRPGPTRRHPSDASRRDLADAALRSVGSRRRSPSACSGTNCARDKVCPKLTWTVKVHLGIAGGTSVPAQWICRRRCRDKIKKTHTRVKVYPRLTWTVKLKRKSMSYIVGTIVPMVP